MGDGANVRATVRAQRAEEAASASRWLREGAEPAAREMAAAAGRAERAVVPERGLWVGGAWRPCAARLPVLDPSDGAHAGSVPAGSAADAAACVAAARVAFGNGNGMWPASTGARRAAVLRRAAELVARDKPRLAALEAVDAGKPIEEAEWDIDDVAGVFSVMADHAERLDSESATIKLDLGDDGGDFSSEMVSEPLGVVAASECACACAAVGPLALSYPILLAVVCGPRADDGCSPCAMLLPVIGSVTPWNYPLLMATWKVAPALAAGCCVVLKPSEVASLTCLELGPLLAEAGLPAGAFSVLTGLGSVAGAALAASPDVDCVAFTGSRRTGAMVAAAAAQNVVPVSLELGGKSSLIVFDDADVERAVQWALFGSMWTNGQICSATSRLLLHERIAPAFLAALKREAEAIHIAHPLERASRLGPIVSAAQYAKVLGFIEEAKREGICLLCGGGVPAGMPATGYWLQPTIFVNVPESSKIWNEEIFGPVLSVRTFRSEEEAVRAANNTVYGLAGAVITEDAARARRVVQAMRCGITWVNCSQPCFCQVRVLTHRRAVRLTTLLLSAAIADPATRVSRRLGEA